MTEKSNIEKLRILLPHWIEHNHSHGAEFEKWAQTMREEDQNEAAALIEKAIATMKDTDNILSEALQKIGGLMEGHHHHHHGEGHD